MGVSTRSISIQLFELIEKRGSVSVDDVVEKFGIPHRSAATVLSRWCGKGFLALERPKRVIGERYKPRAGKYKIGPLAWSDRFYGRRGTLDEKVRREIQEVIFIRRRVTAKDIAAEVNLPVKLVLKYIATIGQIRTRIVDEEMVYESE